LFNTISTLKNGKYTQDLNKITFKTFSKTAELEGEFSDPEDGIIGVEYFGPLGNNLYVANIEMGDLTLTLRCKGKNGEIIDEKNYKAEKSASFETNWLNKPPKGLKFLQWNLEII